MRPQYTPQISPIRPRAARAVVFSIKKPYFYLLKKRQLAQLAVHPLHTKMYVFLKQNYMFWDPAGEVWPRKEALRNARRAFPRAVVFVAHSSRLESPKDLPKPAPGAPRCSRVPPGRAKNIP